ncbi:unnamed protein product [Clonostachys rhizophaga]|uniref:Uncharacterized protein n=1 Tax=Clonostachys rhizophaga TaxID=160324 RepID=A0A9N9VJ98_9HYPO|nr:unnamed protein product [Clonostachys rhizophaga]
MNLFGKLHPPAGSGFIPPPLGSEKKQKYEDEMRIYGRRMPGAAPRLEGESGGGGEGEMMALFPHDDSLTGTLRAELHE